MGRMIPCVSPAFILAFLTIGANARILLIDDQTLTTDPPAATGVQDVKPIVGQRGVAIDGSLRVPMPSGLAIAGNPWEENWNAYNWFDSIRMDTGAYSVSEVDIALPSPGVTWVIGRSYNPLQHTGGGSPTYRASNGPQGKNWFQSSQPELVFDDDAIDDSKDRLYLVYQADAFIEFARVMDETTPTDVFRAVNGAAGAIEFIEDISGPDLYRYTDQVGCESEFFGFDDGTDIPSAIEGQLWRITIPTGARAYVGHETSPATAITAGFFTDGKQKLAYDTAGRRYTYTETAAIGGVNRYAQVMAEVDDAGWREVSRVDYEYYTADGDDGMIGDLKLVTITTPLSPASGEDLITQTYYRYWNDDGYNSSTHPGVEHLLRLVVGPEGLRQFDYAGDGDFDGDFLSATDTALLLYSDISIEYYAHGGGVGHRVRDVIFNGLCSCSGGTSGEYGFEYTLNGSYSNGAGYDTAWATRTVVDPPLSTATKIAQYYDEAHQPLSRAESTAFDTSAKEWVHGIERTSAGFVEKHHYPAHVSTYDHSSTVGAITYKTDDGLVHIYGRETSGDLIGFATSMKYIDYDVTADPQYLIWSRTFFDDTGDEDRKTIGGVFDIVLPLVADQYDFVTRQTSGTTDADHTSYDYTFHDNLVLESMTETEPTVVTAENGSNTATTIKTFYNADMTPAWTVRQDGAIEYRGYDDFAQLNMLIEDANTSSGDFSGITIPTGVNSTGSPLHAKTTYVYDDQGRLELVTPPDGRVAETFYTQLLDRRIVKLTPALEDSGDYYGPVGYVVYDHAGNEVVRAVIGFDASLVTISLDNWIDSADDDPITAFEGNISAPPGELMRLTTREYSATGARLAHERVYFSIPATGAGDTTNFDQSSYVYDAMGRVEETWSPSGTVIMNGYNARNRLASKRMAYDDGMRTSRYPHLYWSGTHDAVSSDDPNGTGTNDGTGGGGAGTGEGELTTTQCVYWILASSSQPLGSQMMRDQRGFVRAIYQPEQPHLLIDRDMQGRVTAIGMYEVDRSTYPLDYKTSSAVSLETNRLALVQFDYDARGRLWKTTWHKIDATDGSSGDTLTEEKWFDATGRLIKFDGDELLKMSFDRLDRLTHQFVLASDNDTQYSDASSVVGDIVLAERQTIYDGVSDDVLIQAVLERFHDDSATGTTGALDDNADNNQSTITAADLNGRIQVDAFWYDALGRVDTIGHYGRFDGTSFSHGTKPTASVAEGAGTPVLVETYSYDAAGELRGSTDPRGIEDRYIYDDAGRILKTIANFVDGTPGGGTNDDEDQVVEREYALGLVTKLIARNPGGDDQTTEYIYGTEFDGSESHYESGHLLSEIRYPDKSGTDDVVRLKYGQGLKVSKVTDQAGNVISIAYDNAKRETHKTLSEATGFDDRVEFIETRYDALGRLSQVQQKNGSTVLDDTLFEYDGWGPS